MNHKKKIKVLFLSAWYPNRYDAMAGLFVRKHAEAVSLYCDVTVLYVHGDKNIDTFEVVKHKHGVIDEITIYYPSRKKTLKTINYFLAYIRGFKQVNQNGFMANVLHANILTRTGFAAFCYKTLTKTPYVISEHWSRYLPKQNGYRGMIRKLITRLVVKHASAIMPVSETLQKAMIDNKLIHPDYQIIYNVVDDFFYHKHKVTQKSPLKRFLHISCFDEKAKNVKGILRATKSLCDLRDDFELIIIGSGIDYGNVYEYYTSLQFNENRVKFLGEKTPVEVAEWFACSDCFVLFSYYETAGVVIAESMASGKPVISTRVGIAAEFIDKETGILIEPGDESGLMLAMNQVLNSLDNYSPSTIKLKSELFSYQTVGEKIKDIYVRILLQ